MNIRKISGFMFAVALAQFVLAAPSAFAHRFNVALMVPLTGDAVTQGQQIRNGFMLATTERDSHADEESDGHLGGLDVYVAVRDSHGDMGAQIGQILTQGQTDILAVLGSEKTQKLAARLLEGKDVALLVPGQSPFANSGQPGVAAFIAAYERAYGEKPTARAALGYNAARRIDVAVRGQGGAGDRDPLRQSFARTARQFSW